MADKDQAVCGKKKLLDESLVVDKESRGIADVVVYLLQPEGRDVPVHASYKEKAREPAKMVIRDCRCEPHVLLMRTTQPLHLDSNDPIGHNANLQASANALFSQIVPADSAVS